MSGKFRKCLLFTLSVFVFSFFSSYAFSKTFVVNGFRFQYLDKNRILGLRAKAEGDVLFRRNHKAEALKYYEIATRYIPNEADVYFRLGEIYFNNEIYKMAISYYDKALVKYTYPENAEKPKQHVFLALIHKGYALIKVNKIDKAQDILNILDKHKKALKEHYPNLAIKVRAFYILALGDMAGRVRWNSSD